MLNTLLASPEVKAMMAANPEIERILADPKVKPHQTSRIPFQLSTLASWSKRRSLSSAAAARSGSRPCLSQNALVVRRLYED